MQTGILKHYSIQTLTWRKQAIVTFGKIESVFKRAELGCISCSVNPVQKCVWSNSKAFLVIFEQVIY